ncbi:MAG TPA: pectate lyase [Pirellulaceae bacterium]|jgi:PelA/Pel-15E family pectate lyase|nr:pectate lyase [Pirellulaceae bacterium]
MNGTRRFYVVAIILGSVISPGGNLFGQDAALRTEVLTALRDATSFYRQRVASHGGYVYFYSHDLSRRWGEGVATADQIWVQPPGTPTVGMAYLKAYRATGERIYLEAATAAAEALVYGQLASGGWTNLVDFDPRSRRVAKYRNGRGGGKNNSSFDDGQSQSALQLLINVDQALDFKQNSIHEAVQIGLEAVLGAQFPNGAFPQVWTGPVVAQPALKANYPGYDWRTEGRIKNYWDMYTLNDNVTGYVAETLIDAHRTYGEEKYLAALRRLGDFLVLAQMPEPQPGWAQQYNYAMQPIWARKFEPPGVSGDESQEVLETLMRIAHVTADRKYLAPIPTALAWLKRSQLPDGQVARYYELKSNRPLYMTRRGDKYALTYDDSDLPKHYGWKTEARIADIEKQHQALIAGGQLTVSTVAARPSRREVRQILATVDDRGRWFKTYNGERLVGQAKMTVGAKYLSSELFSRNLTILSAFVSAPD